jgi:predicted Fe-Mo cluster-binding NifX family protein
MKIAAVTENGKTISNHFGRAPYFTVITVQGNEIVAEERRNKAFHGQSEGHAQTHDHNLHEDMFTPIVDCDILLCGGMGEPAYQKAIASGLNVILTGGEIDDAIAAYLTDHLASDMRRIHHH